MSRGKMRLKSGGAGKGVLVISLDLELYWGLRDKRELAGARNRLLGAREAIPEILKLFAEHDIHATWAVVGFLFFDSKRDLLQSLPEKKPSYVRRQLDPYRHLENLGEDEASDPFHYAASLVRRIAESAGQEIATHTFSHFYCLEPGPTAAEFEADLKAARAAAARLEPGLESLIFPRNQVNPALLEVCRQQGIRSFRGTGHSWLQRAAEEGRKSWTRRALRLLDAYLPLSGPNSYDPRSPAGLRPYDLAASRFLRPYSPAFRWLEPLRMNRILSGLEHAARHGRVYHLWWHPHNFGVHMEANLAFLRRILEHYSGLAASGRMESLNMRELAGRLEAS